MSDQPVPNQNLNNAGPGMCGSTRPVFYNMCISLSDASGPVFHDNMPVKDEQPIQSQPTLQQQMPKHVNCDSPRPKTLMLPSLIRIGAAAQEEKECSITLDSEKGSPGEESEFSGTTFPSKESIHSIDTTDVGSEGSLPEEVESNHCPNKDLCGYYHCQLGHKKDVNAEYATENHSEMCPMSFKTVITLTGEMEPEPSCENRSLIRVEPVNVHSDNTNVNINDNRAVSPENQNIKCLRRYSTILRFTEGSTDTVYTTNMPNESNSQASDVCGSKDNDSNCTQQRIPDVTTKKIFEYPSTSFFMNKTPANEETNSIAYTFMDCHIENSIQPFLSLPGYYNAPHIDVHSIMKNQNSLDRKLNLQIMNDKNKNKKLTSSNLTDKFDVPNTNHDEDFQSDDPNMLLLLRKSSHTSDYSRSSRSSATSTCSSCSNVSCCSIHKTSQDSDYYGSSSDESKKPPSDTSESDEDEDVLSPLGVLKLRYIGTSGILRSSRRTKNMKVQRKPSSYMKPVSRFRNDVVRGPGKVAQCPRIIGDFNAISSCFAEPQNPNMPTLDEDKESSESPTINNLNSNKRRHTLPSAFKEYDLEQRIALEIKMREGTTKLLAACGAKGPRSNQPHTLEAAKNLLTSNDRMTAYMAELQRRRSSATNHETPGVEPSLARVCLSDLRMPLIWKDSDHFKNKGDYRRFAVFVLLKIGTEIYDTVMVNPVDRSMTDISFDDIIVFNGIPSNFECRMEVYSHVLQNDLSMASTPRKLKRTLHSSISRTVGRKLAASLRDELSSGEMGPKFELVATTKLKLDCVSNSISSFDLTLENVENRTHQLPLFGNFCCRLAAQPDCSIQERIAGHVHVPESEHKKSWCRLYGWRLEVWENKEEVHTSPDHPLSISIDRTTEIKTKSANTLIVSNTAGLERGSLTLNFESTEEASNWQKVLEQHIADHKCWGAAAEEDMEILTPQPTRHNFLLPRRGRYTSLYEETPLRDGSPSSEKSSFDDLYTPANYTSSSYVSSFCTPSLNTPRTRAFTLSNRSSFRRWGSVRCNMPFFKTKS